MTLTLSYLSGFAQFVVLVGAMVAALSLAQTRGWVPEEGPALKRIVGGLGVAFGVLLLFGLVNPDAIYIECKEGVSWYWWLIWGC